MAFQRVFNQEEKDLMFKKFQSKEVDMRRHKLSKESMISKQEMKSKQDSKGNL